MYGFPGEEPMRADRSGLKRTHPRIRHYRKRPLLWKVQESEEKSSWERIGCNAPGARPGNIVKGASNYVYAWLTIAIASRQFQGNENRKRRCSGKTKTRKYSRERLLLCARISARRLVSNDAGVEKNRV